MHNLNLSEIDKHLKHITQFCIYIRQRIAIEFNITFTTQITFDFLTKWTYKIWTAPKKQIDGHFKIFICKTIIRIKLYIIHFLKDFFVKLTDWTKNEGSTEGWLKKNMKQKSIVREQDVCRRYNWKVVVEISGNQNEI